MLLLRLPLEETGANEELEWSVSFGAEQYPLLSLVRQRSSNNFSNGSPTETLSKLRRGKLSPAGGRVRWAIPILLPTTARVKSAEREGRGKRVSERADVFGWRRRGTDHISSCRTCVDVGNLQDWIPHWDQSSWVKDPLIFINEWGGNLSRMTVVTVLNFAQYKRGAKIHSLDCCSGSPDSRSVWRSRVLFARAPEGANDSTCFFPTEERGREEDGINNGGSDEERGRKRREGRGRRKYCVSCYTASNFRLFH